MSLTEFLAADFARFDAALVARCARLDGERLYLTGATGFFGRNLLALLAFLHERGLRFEVTALSRNPAGFLAAHPPFRQAPWLSWEAGDVAAAWPAQGTYRYLLHAATDTDARAHLDKLAVFEGLLAGTRRAVEFAATHGVRRLLLTGSGAEYGAIPAAYAQGIPEASAIACDPLRSASAYGEGKRAAELLATLHGERHGFEVVAGRGFAFTGPGLALDGHFAIGNFLRSALGGQTLRLASAGTAVRSYLYSADLALWLLILLLEAPGGTAVNLGSDEPISILELARRVRDLVGPGLAIEPGPARPLEERQVYVPSIGLARSLGLDVWTRLNEAIIRTAHWHRCGASP